MDWLLLIVAGVLEIGWALCLKESAGFTRWAPAVGFFVLMLGSVYLLSLALRSIPLGTAYAVWTGIGVVGAAVAGMVLFGESCDLRRVACIGLIVAGIAGLKLTSQAG
jgi:quaternary ammonium compound-resistance protein SugE